MRSVILVLKVAMIVALIADLFFWLVAHASGHKIPAKMDWSFGISAGLLILVLMVLFFLSRER